MFVPIMLFMLLFPLPMAEFTMLFMLPASGDMAPKGDDAWPMDVEEACRWFTPVGGGGSRGPGDVMLPPEGGGASEKDDVGLMGGRC